jgi:ornithine--oxo-acid transaminase
MQGRIDVANILAHSAANAPGAMRRHLHPPLMRLLEMLGFDHEFTRGDGCHLWMKDGTRVLDCLAGFGAHLLGRNHPTVRDALQQCLNVGSPGWIRMAPNGLAAEAARRLKEACGRPEDLVYFANSGTEAVEAAIKFARRHTGRSGVIGWQDGFHGFTLGSLSASGVAGLAEGFGALLPDSHSVPFGDLDAVQRLVSRGGIAAMIIEPIQGKTLRALAPGSMRSLHDICKRHGTLLIADEVQTGVGRTGTFLACSHDGVEPDLVTLSKGLSGGFVPVASVLVRPHIWRSTFDGMERAFVHSSTHHESPLAMMALIATLQVVEAENLVERSRQLGDRLMSSLRKSLTGCDAAPEVRGRGLMLGVALDAETVPSLRGIPLIEDWTAPMVGQALVMDLLREELVLAQVTETRKPVLKLLPALVLQDSDASTIEAAVPRAVRRLADGSARKAIASAATALLRSRLRMW